MKKTTTKIMPALPSMPAVARNARHATAVSPIAVLQVSLDLQTRASMS